MPLTNYHRDPTKKNHVNSKNHPPLVGGWTNPFKNISQNGNLLQNRGENKTSFAFFDAPSFGPLSKTQSGRLFYLKPPPSSLCEGWCFQTPLQKSRPSFSTKRRPRCSARLRTASLKSVFSWTRPPQKKGVFLENIGIESTIFLGYVSMLWLFF